MNNDIKISDLLPGIGLQEGDKFEMNGNQYEVTNISEDICLKMTEEGKKDQEIIQSIYDLGLNEPTVLDCKDKMINEL